MRLSLRFLIPLAIGLGRWLAVRSFAGKPIVEAALALPLVLPPTVLGFYLLVTLNPTTAIGGAWERVFGMPLTFSFEGLVVASVLYSLPFAVQPLQAAFAAVGRGPC